jgi:aromatic-L-amino-acid decarboxylase
MRHPHASLEQLPPSATLRPADAGAGLELAPEAMRRLGYRAVDAVIDHIANLRERPAVRGATRAQMEALLREELPRTGGDPERLLQQLLEDVTAFGVRTEHPAFFGYIPLSPTFPGIVGDLLATGTSLFAGSWLGSPGAATLEVVVTDWFARLVGMPESAAGLLTSGGSMANLIGLACARRAKLGEQLAGARVYTSDQAHAAVARAVVLLGLAAESVVVLASNDRFELDVPALEEAIARDRRAGLRPFCVAATAGTTNTGAIDALVPLADLCAAHELWLHVDGAYGGFAVLTGRGRRLLAGIERADSVVLDPHKWLHQPLECGCVLLRDEAELLRTFASNADYLQDIPRLNREINFFERGIELSRSARAVKIWLSLKTFGADRFGQAVDQALDLALYAAARVDEAADLQRMAPVPLSTVAMRCVPPGWADDDPHLDTLQLSIVDALIRRQAPVFLTSTRLRGRVALRLCVLSHRTTAADVDLALSTVQQLGRELAQIRL